MNDFQFFNIFIFWTRSIVLLLSITIVILSLTVYNSNSTPISTLLEYETDVLQSDQIISDTVQDRRLIATLVAAQASIFCPLFLLMSSATLKFCPDYFGVLSNMDIFRIGIEQFCQILMPLGLTFSWLFCVTFDRKTETAMMIENLEDTWSVLGASVTENLKYITVIVLLMEILGICIVSFKYVSYLLISQKQNSIRLIDDVETSIPNTEKQENTLDI